MKNSCLEIWETNDLSVHELQVWLPFPFPPEQQLVLPPPIFAVVLTVAQSGSYKPLNVARLGLVGGWITSHECRCLCPVKPCLPGPLTSSLSSATAEHINLST